MTVADHVSQSTKLSSAPLRVHNKAVLLAVAGMLA